MCLLLGHFLCCVSLHLYICSVSWLFWLSRQYASDWLERLLWRSLFALRRLSSQSPGQRALNTCGFSILLCCVFVFRTPALHSIFHTPVSWSSLLVLKVPLNTSQPTNHGNSLVGGGGCNAVGIALNSLKQQSDVLIVQSVCITDWSRSTLRMQIKQTLICPIWGPLACIFLDCCWTNDEETLPLQTAMVKFS